MADHLFDDDTLLLFILTNTNQMKNDFGLSNICNNLIHETRNLFHLYILTQIRIYKLAMQFRYLQTLYIYHS